MLGRILLIGLILYVLYYWFKRITQSKKKRPTPYKEGEVRIFKTKETEKSNYSVKGEFTEFEEIKENE